MPDKLVEVYPTTPPMLVSMMDTAHASIPYHFHFHLIPSLVNMRKLLSTYDPTIPENRIIELSELELMAQRLR